MLRQVVTTVCFAGTLLTAGIAVAQQIPQPGSQPTTKEKGPIDKKEPVQPPAAPAQSPRAQAATPAATLAVPEPEVLLMLIRTTLIALNQANQTGNYTVLHDLGSPSFQAINSAAQLGIAFANLRNQNFDLSPVALITPQVTEAPQITDQGTLRVAGYFPTQPFQIKFQMLFQSVSGKWRLFGMSVTAAPGNAPQAAPSQAPAPAQKK